jgi:hypothetical protein
MTSTQPSATAGSLQLFCLHLQADESPQLYWQFLDSLDLTSAAADAADDSSSSSACWHRIIDQASALCLPQVAKVRQQKHICSSCVHGSTSQSPWLGLLACWLAGLLACLLAFCPSTVAHNVCLQCLCYAGAAEVAIACRGRTRALCDHVLPGCKPLMCWPRLLAAADPACCGWGASVLSAPGDVQAACSAAGSSPGNIASLQLPPDT